MGGFLFEYNHLRRHGGLNYMMPFDKLLKVIYFFIYYHHGLIPSGEKYADKETALEGEILDDLREKVVTISWLSLFPLLRNWDCPMWRVYCLNWQRPLLR
jgi:hypothetical protein